MIYRLTSQDAASTTSTLGVVTATYAATPTQNNLLVAFYTGDAPTTSTTAPTGWTVAGQRNFNTSLNSISMAYKIAVAGESTSVIYTGTAATAQNLHIYEYAGINWNLANPRDGNVSAASVGSVTSLGSGSTAAMVYPYDLVLGCCGTAANVTNFALSSMANLQTSVRLVSGFKIVSANGSTQSTTASWTTSSTAAAGVMNFQALPSGLAASGVG